MATPLATDLDTTTLASAAGVAAADLVEAIATIQLLAAVAASRDRALTAATLGATTALADLIVALAAL
jgi:hypothetical protein